MRVLFHSYTLNLRGVTNSIVDYATYNQTILGNESALIYNPDYILEGSANRDIGSVPALVEHLKTKFKVHSYRTAQELNDICSHYDVVYTQKAGLIEEPFITSTKTANHTVFQCYEPHGDRYAYISEWLANRMCRGKEKQYPFVPLTVELPKPEDDLRAELGIPKNKFVFGRHGGFYTFDVAFVIEQIQRIVHKYPDIVFLFANTYPFYKHPNIIYANPFFGGKAKSSFIDACDAMIHARTQGETFGLAMCEFLFQNKPVLAWELGEDRHQVHLLKDHGLLYNEANFEEKLLEVTHRPPQEYSKIVEPFNAVNSMRKFQEVFLT